MQPFVYESAVFNLTFHFTQLKRECNRLHKTFYFFFSSHFTIIKNRPSSRRFQSIFLSIFRIITKRRIRFVSLEYRTSPIIESGIGFVDDERVSPLLD